MLSKATSSSLTSRRNPRYTTEEDKIIIAGRTTNPKLNWAEIAGQINDHLRSIKAGCKRDKRSVRQRWKTNLKANHGSDEEDAEEDLGNGAEDGMKGGDQDERGGQSITQANADEVGPVIQAIHKENSGYTKEQVEAAREENDPDVVAGAVALMNIIHS